MKDKRHSEKLTIANFIAIVGLVSLLVFTFMGHVYLSGGELGWSIIIAVAITAIAALLLWLLIRAKGAENELKKWRFVEYGVLAAYVAFAILSSVYGGIMHFFVVNTKKEELKSLAMNDLQKIEKMLTEYKDFESKALIETEDGLKNATYENQVRSEELNRFLSDNEISPNHESVKNFISIQKTSIMGGYESFLAEYQKQENSILSAVNGWSIMQIPFKAKKISEISQSVSEELSKMSQNAKLPQIVKNDMYWELDSFQKRTFELEGGVDSLQFKSAFQSVKGFSLTALLVVFLIHILILFNYIVAYRTSILETSKYLEEDGGIILKN